MNRKRSLAGGNIETFLFSDTDSDSSFSSDEENNEVEQSTSSNENYEEDERTDVIAVETVMESVFQNQEVYMLAFSSLYRGVRYSSVFPKSLARRGMCSTVEDDVIFESEKNNRIITLNRPKAMNALNLSMIRKMYPQIKKWEEDLDTGFILMKGAGPKAFCAGGDVKAIALAIKSGGTLPADFFREEYQLDNLIGTLKVPFVALIDGITMGGGVGLSVHGHFRIATERTVFAMPETAIGLFPDVGGTYFLPKLGGQLGLFLALTGYRLKGRDVQKCGVATHYVTSDMIEDLEQELRVLKSKSLLSIQDILDKYHGRYDKILLQCFDKRKDPPFSLESRLGKINTMFNCKNVEDIITKLQEDGTEWSLEIVKLMKSMSPISMKVTLKQLTRFKDLSLQEALQMEYRISQRCMADHDFYEGVRAAMIDKDYSPSWVPSKLSQVTKKHIDSYFDPLHPDLELKL
ncbi:3-hydroxyisobutyryl-CoA hydrolase, mitochondrial [Nymphon striatum]|nr:3-hydroxyisobutyryl-CoA hydrolase, mitochondrial [Nymphon striatum]